MWKCLEKRMPRARRRYISRYLAYQFLCEHWHTYVSIDGAKPTRLIMGHGPWNRSFCADCFPFVHKSDLYVFYETVDAKRKGIIGCFKYNGGKWEQLGVVLENPWHMSYPQVFEDDGHIYMIPEQSACGKVSLYEAKIYPFKWENCADLINRPFADATLVRKDGHYYLSCYEIPPNEKAELWHSSSLLGPWEKHPCWNQVNQSPRLRRCGGAFFEEDGQLFRVGQDCNGDYGKRLFKVSVNMLSPSQYAEGKATLLLGRSDHSHSAGKHTYNTVMWRDKRVVCFDCKQYRLKPFGEIFSVIFRALMRFVRRKKGERE